MSPDRSAAKRAIARIYDRTAGPLYETVVVKGSFRLFGGELNDLVVEQGRRAVASAAGRPILDMPIGTGFFTTQIAPEHDGVVVGTDIATGMVREAKEAAVRSGVDNLAPLQADVHSLPFRDGAFGAVLCTNGLQVIPGLEPAIKELARVLAPGGMMYVSVVTLPLSRALPKAVAPKLPTIMRSGVDVAEVLSEAGVYVTRVTKTRLATLLDALKPVHPQRV